MNAAGSRTTRSCVPLVIAALAASTAHASARPATGPRVFVGCLGKPEVRPREIDLACGDGTQSVGSIVWTGRGESFTAGRGVATINDCRPNCAAGRAHSYPVLLLLTGRERCRPGAPIAYRKLTMAFLDGSPHTTATETFPCR